MSTEIEAALRPVVELDTLPKPTHLNTDTVKNDLVQWLIDQAWIGAFLLAHADDGVIWGHFKQNDDNKLLLTTSHDAFPQLPKLRIETLWQVRIFGCDAEVMLWRTGKTWQAHKLTDTGHDPEFIIKEAQMLWGDHAKQREKGFTLLEDGSEGLRHAVPLDITDDAFKNPQDKNLSLRPLRLHVRHYITYDQHGNARIGLSRLVDLEVQS